MQEYILLLRAHFSGGKKFNSRKWGGGSRKNRTLFTSELKIRNHAEKKYQDIDSHTYLTI